MNIDIISQNIANNPQDFSAEQIKDIMDQLQKCQSSINSNPLYARITSANAKTNGIDDNVIVVMDIEFILSRNDFNSIVRNDLKITDINSILNLTK